MVLAFVKLENYPAYGGYFQFDFKRPDGSIFFTPTTPLPVPDSSWTWWYAFAWVVVGRFDNTSGFSDNEIIEPGRYEIRVLTPWGGSTIDFNVTGTPPVLQAPTILSVSAINLSTPGSVRVAWNQDIAGVVAIDLDGVNQFTSGQLTAGIHNYVLSGISGGYHIFTVRGKNSLNYGFVVDSSSQQMNVVFEVQGNGSFMAYKNNNLMGTAFKNVPITVSYTVGDTIGFQAYALTNGTFTKICDYPQTECQTVAAHSYTVAGQLPQKMIAYFDAACLSDVWACEVPANGYEVNGCGERRANQRCNPVGEDVFNLSVDKNSIALGESVTLSVTGHDNDVIEFYEKELIGNKLLGKGRTLTIQPVGSRTYVARYYGIDGLSDWSNEVYLAVIGGTDGGIGDLTGLILPAVGLLGAAYVLGNLFGRK